MLTERKHLLRLFEVICLAAATASLVLAGLTWLTPNQDFPVLLWGVAGTALQMLTFLPACMLGGEYVKTVKKTSALRRQTKGLTSVDLANLLRWAPVTYKAGAVAAVLILVASTFLFGSIKFDAESPIEPKQVTGIFLYLAVFFLLALPVLGSASRMPGTYAAHSAA